MIRRQSEALAAGERRYVSGKPCRRGHYGERYTNGGACIECIRVRTGRPMCVRARGTKPYKSRVLVSRKQSRALGLPVYFTGNPCKHGHITFRSTKTGKCFGCDHVTTGTARPWAFSGFRRPLKWCNRCRLYKPYIDFPPKKRRSSPNRIDSYCRKCSLDRKRESRKRATEQLTDGHIRRLIVQHDKRLKSINLPAWVIDFKRKHILLKRAIEETKNG